MDYKGSVNRMNSKIKSDKTRVDTSWRVNELTSEQVVSSVSVTGSSNFSHLFANRFPPVPASFITCFLFLSHPLQHSLSPVLHFFLTCYASFTHAYNVSLIVMRHKFHHEETLVSSRWDTRFITMRLIKDTDKKDARCMRKRCATREKECWNGWERKQKPISQRACIGCKSIGLVYDCK